MAKDRTRGRARPLRQSERLDLYRKHAQTLIDAGHAYYCFCTSSAWTECESSRPKTPLRATIGTAAASPG